MNAVTHHRPATALCPQAWRRVLRHPLPTLLLWLSACVLLPLLLSGCLGGGDDPATPPPESRSAVIGPAGGTLIGPDGVELVVPAGALATTTTLTITRTAEGAPAPGGNLRTEGAVYEFTPHDLYFAQPVTIAFPQPVASATLLSTSIFMVSPSDATLGNGAWQEQTTQIVNGKATIARNRLSWGGPMGCAWSRTPPPPDSGCVYPTGNARVAASPSTALQTLTPVWWGGYGGSYRVTEASSLTFGAYYRNKYHCTNNRLKLYREQMDPVFHTSLGAPQLIEDVPAPLTLSTTASAPFMSGTGTATLSPIPVSHLNNGFWRYYVVNTCLNAETGLNAGGSDVVQVEISVPVPSVTYAIGGHVSGLTGAGLVLQNNGGDNLAVGADGAFTFATPVGSGTPYSVTVLTQPAGQTCSVSNGSGTASANVTSVAVSCSGVRSWQTATLLETSNAGHAEGAEVALNASGDGMAVWSQSNGSTTDIWARRYTVAGGWGTAQLIETTSGNAMQPHVTVDAAGNAVAVWSQQASTHYDILANRFNAVTALWGSEVLLEAGAGEAYSPRVTYLANGDAVAVWSQGSGNPTIQANRLVAGSWGSAQTISGGSGSAYQPQVVALGNTAIVAWVQDSGGQDHIFFNTFNGTGWSTADWLSDPANTNGSTEAPQIASDGSGRALVVWSQSDGADTNVYQRLFHLGSWAAIGTVDTNGAPYAVNPHVTMNASGQAAVGWTEGVADGGHPWVRGWSPTTGWDSATQIDTTLSATRGDAPAVAIDGAGNVIAVWSAEVTTLSGDLYAIHRSAAGSWGTPVLLETGSEAAIAPKLAVDPTGRAVALWNQAAAALESVWAALFR